MGGAGVGGVVRGSTGGGPGMGGTGEGMMTGGMAGDAEMKSRIAILSKLIKLFASLLPTRVKLQKKKKKIPPQKKIQNFYCFELFTSSKSPEIIV